MADKDPQLDLVPQEFSEDGVFTLSHYKKEADAPARDATTERCEEIGITAGNVTKVPGGRVATDP